VIPGEVLWPTLAFGSMIVLVFGGIALLRILPRHRSNALDQSERARLEDLEARIGQLEEQQQRIGELEERVDFAERLLAKQREAERPRLPDG
jgi:hypothetical protein